MGVTLETWCGPGGRRVRAEGCALTVAAKFRDMTWRLAVALKTHCVALMLGGRHIGDMWWGPLEAVTLEAMVRAGGVCVACGSLWQSCNEVRPW